METNHWTIYDQSVIDAIQRLGFICHHTCDKWCQPERHQPWYDTDLPISFNGQFRFDDGTIIKSHGTQLVLIQGCNAFHTFQIDDGMGGTIELIQYPMPPQPEYETIQLVPYDKL